MYNLCTEWGRMIKETNTKRHCAVAVIRTSPILTGFSCYSSQLPNITTAVRFRISFTLSFVITRLCNGGSFFIFTKQQTE